MSLKLLPFLCICISELLRRNEKLCKEAKDCETNGWSPVFQTVDHFNNCEIDYDFGRSKHFLDLSIKYSNWFNFMEFLFEKYKIRVMFFFFLIFWCKIELMIDLIRSSLMVYLVVWTLVRVFCCCWCCLGCARAGVGFNVSMNESKHAYDLIHWTSVYACECHFEWKFCLTCFMSVFPMRCLFPYI